MTTKDTQEESLRDAFFEPFRTFKTVQGRALAATILEALEAYEAATGQRQRTRKAKNRETLLATLDAVLADVLRLALIAPEKRLAVPLSHGVLGLRNRYSAPALNQQLPYLVEALAAPSLGYLELTKGRRLYGLGQDQRTTIKATPKLVTLAEALGLSLEDIGRSAAAETIILKGEKDKDDVFDRADWVDYRDTPETVRMRENLRRINEWLAEGDIAFDDAVLPDTIVDTGDRLLRRYFNRGSFDQGGRFFGGFWQKLSKTARHEGLTINGERAVTLDYGQMGVRILYGLAGIEPPEGDAYALRGFERHRAGVKKVLAAMMFTEKPLSRLPRGTAALFPGETRIGDIKEAIRESDLPP